MLKKRIIPVLLLSGNRTVKGKNFKDYIDTGNPITQVKIYSSQHTDEIIFIDIDASSKSKKTLKDTIRIASKESHMPFTAGGGIKKLDDIYEILAEGADKVIINTAAYYDRKLVVDAVKAFGSQAIILGIDYKFDKKDNNNYVWTHSGLKKTKINPIKLALDYQDLNIGELFINSIDRDGVMDGYDISLGSKISEKLKIPVTIAGGAGNFSHLLELFQKTEASAAACGSIFHFGDNSPLRARSYLKNQGIEVRKIK